MHRLSKGHSLPALQDEVHRLLQVEDVRRVPVPGVIDAALRGGCHHQVVEPQRHLRRATSSGGNSTSPALSVQALRAQVGGSQYNSGLATSRADSRAPFTQEACRKHSVCDG